MVTSLSTAGKTKKCVAVISVQALISERNFASFSNVNMNTNEAQLFLITMVESQKEIAAMWNERKENRGRNNSRNKMTKIIFKVDQGRRQHILGVKALIGMCEMFEGACWYHKISVKKQLNASLTVNKIKLSREMHSEERSLRGRPTVP